MPKPTWLGPVIRLVSLLAMLTLSSCGTVLTRVDPAYHYPGKSVVEDLRLMVKRATGASSYGLRYWELNGSRLHAGGFILSLPIDLALDTLLLPYDVGVGVYRLLSDDGAATVRPAPAADGASGRN